MRSRGRLLRACRACCVTIAFAMQAIGVAAQEPAHCPVAPADVSGASANELEAVCDGARAAADFLAAAGASVPDRVAIEVVPALPEGLPADSVGCYAMQGRKVMLLRLEVLESRRTWLGATADRALYRSIATHEVAHAIARCQSGGSRPMSRLAHEYLANVAMYATMAPDLRERLLAAHPGEGWAHAAQINILDYLADPALFGANAWRHWASLDDGAGWLREVLDGTGIVEMERD